jgi:hypothetical protein
MLKGTPNYAAALRLILGATKHWINTADPEDPPSWVERTALDTLERFEFTEQEFLAELAALGIAPTTAPPPPVVLPSKADLAAHAANRRWEAETGGCTWNGKPVATDRDSQSKLVAEYVAIQAGLRADPSPWKFADGTFASLSNADAAAMILAARAHVAACFAVEAAVLAEIEAGTVATVRAVNAASWPAAGAQVPPIQVAA